MPSCCSWLEGERNALLAEITELQTAAAEQQQGMGGDGPLMVVPEAARASSPLPVANNLCGTSSSRLDPSGPLQTPPPPSAGSKRGGDQEPGSTEAQHREERK